MDTRRLGYFVCVAETGSLGRASEVLRIAQPALTRQVRQLEAEVGLTLFTRTRRGMQLTEDGEQLFADVIGPLRQLERAFRNTAAVSSGLSGSIAIGMPPTVACCLAQPLLEKVSREEANIDVRLVEGTARHIDEWLVSGELDMAVLYEASRNDKLSARELIVEDMVLVGPRDCALLPQRPLSFRDVAKLPLILPNPRNGLRAASDAQAALYKTRFQIKYVIDSLPTLKQMVIDGHGYTILPLSAVLTELEMGRLRYAPIDKPVKRTLVLATKAHNRSSRIMTKMDVLIRDLLLALFDGQRIFGDLKIQRTRRPGEEPDVRRRPAAPAREAGSKRAAKRT